MGDYTADSTRPIARQKPKRYSSKASPFLNEVRQVMRLLHMSKNTEASYLRYILDYIRFTNKRHPAQRN